MTTFVAMDPDRLCPGPQFLTATTPTLDWSAKICVIAFSVAIPLLAALLLVNHQETSRRRVAD